MVAAAMAAGVQAADAHIYTAFEQSEHTAAPHSGWRGFGLLMLFMLNPT